MTMRSMSLFGRLKHPDGLAVEERQRVFHALLKILAIDLDDAVAQVRRQDYVGSAGEGMVLRERLAMKHIQRGNDPTRSHCMDQCRFLDELRPCGVDENRPMLQEREIGSAKYPPRPLGQHEVQAYNICRAQQFLLRHT